MIIYPFNANKLSLKDRFSLFPMFDEYVDRVYSKGRKRNDGLMALDIIEKETEFEVKADLPGVQKENIKLTSKENYILIEAVKHKQPQDESKVHYSERYTGSYARRIFLPDNCDIENVKAKLKNGVLTLTVPKTDNIKKEIKIS